MKWLKNLFSESSDVSCMRVMAMISLLMGCCLALIGKDTSVIVFVSSAFAAKFSQKFVETRKSTEITTKIE